LFGRGRRWGVIDEGGTTNLNHVRHTHDRHVRPDDHQKRTGGWRSYCAGNHADLHKKLKRRFVNQTAQLTASALSVSHEKQVGLGIERDAVARPRLGAKSFRH
jgi:hypothetical protein